MTEAEWLSPASPRDLAQVAARSWRASDRTIRLFIAAYWGVKARFSPGRQRLIAQRMVAATEHWAETGRLPKGYRESRSKTVVFHNADARAALMLCLPNWPPPTRDREANARSQSLLRDIFGNPFRPIAFSPEWRTDTAVALARGMYEARDFGAMATLGDALQDAGCNNDDILNHCRDGSATHVRGCWVVDLVLGKS